LDKAAGLVRELMHARAARVAMAPRREEHLADLAGKAVLPEAAGEDSDQEGSLDRAFSQQQIPTKTAL
jgi:hypothetical protein